MKIYKILIYIQLNNWYKKAILAKKKKKRETEAFKCIYKK